MKLKRTLFLNICVVLLTGCANNGNDLPQLLKAAGASQKFVARRYYNERPLAALVDMPVYTELEQLFVLNERTRVQVYGVGELLYNFADGNPDYFFKSDDIELFFEQDKPNEVKSGTSHKRSYFNLSWIDGKAKDGKINFVKDGITFHGYQALDSLNGKYITEFSVPWKALEITSVVPSALGFDIAIGDNDDDFKQEGKIAWSSSSDPLIDKHSQLGKLQFSSAGNHSFPAGLIIRSGSPSIDGVIEKFWESIPVNGISNCVAGSAKDKYDLSARMRICYDKTAIYFLVEIQDSNRKFIIPKRFLKKQTFLDYGWIEDNKGKKVWEMHAVNSSRAGGAVKNRKVDTLITLEKGSYRLRYVSDESHSFNDWDADPPMTPFYGIVVYNGEKNTKH